MKPTFNKYKTIQNRQNQSKKQLKKDTAAQNPIINKDSQIISGYFVQEKSYKEIIISRVNTFLYSVLGTLVIFCLICYYFVSCKEVQLNQISRATLELNYENDELQNKVDTLQSYYNIDKAVSKTNILERAKQVVEVNATDLPQINLKSGAKPKQAFVVGY